MKTVKLLAGAFFIAMMTGCSTKSMTSFYAPEIECLGVEYDGSQTLLTYGDGKNRNDAIEQAMKNAVHEVIFVGIRNGMEGCNMKPILTEVNAEEKYEDYFNAFFRDKGEFSY